MTEDFFAAMGDLDSLAAESRSAESLRRLLEISQAINAILDLDSLLAQIIRGAVEVAGAERGFLMLLGSAGQLDIRAAYGMSGGEAATLEQEVSHAIIQNVVETQRPLRVVDAAGNERFADRSSVIELGLKSVLCAPLATEGAVVGVIYLDHRSRVGAFSEAALDTLQTFGNLAAVAIQNARLHQETQHRAEQLMAVNKLGRALAQTLDLEQIYAQLSDATHQLLPDITSVFISLYDPDNRLITCAHAVHDGEPLNPDELPPIPLEAPGVGTQSEAIHTRRPLIVNDLRSRLRQVKTQVDVGTPGLVTQSGLYVPMLAKGRVIGVMQVQSYARNRFTAADAELLSLAANTAAIAIENVRLLVETRRRLEHLQALRSIDTAITASTDLRVILSVLLDQVTTQLRVDAAAILLLEPHTQTLQHAAGRGFRTVALRHAPLRLGEGYAGRAALERRIMAISDLGLQISDWESRQSEISNLQSAIQAEGFVAYYAAPLVAKGQVLGVLEIFHRTRLAPDREWQDFLEALAVQAAIAIDNAGLFDNLQRSNVELTLAYDTTLEGWARALEMRDAETEGHTRRVTDMTLDLARAMGLREEELIQARRGAVLHDIGKMAIPDSILLKPGELDDDEWEIMRQHPGYAYQLLSPIAFLKRALDIPYCHHEKWDGSGYPRGLKGELIPLPARIFAVADVYDALCSDRPYRKAWPEDEALEYIREQAGQHFDPQVVEVFLDFCSDTTRLLAHLDN